MNIDMLLVGRPGLVKMNVVELFHLYGVHLSSSFLIKISSPFRENNNVVVFPYPFHILMPLVNLWLIHLQG